MATSETTVLLLLAAVLASARAQCVVSAGGLTFDLALANNGKYASHAHAHALHPRAISGLCKRRSLHAGTSSGPRVQLFLYESAFRS